MRRTDYKRVLRTKWNRNSTIIIEQKNHVPGDHRVIVNNNDGCFKKLNPIMPSPERGAE